MQQPKPLGYRVLAVQHQIDHDFRHFRGHAEADLETAIGDVMPGAARPWPQHRRAGFGARAHPGPAFQNFGPGKGGEKGSGKGSGN